MDCPIADAESMQTTHYRHYFSIKFIVFGFLVILLGFAVLGLHAQSDVPLTLVRDVTASATTSGAEKDLLFAVDPLVFNEVWAYLMYNEERFIPVQAGISDLAYFSARISTQGKLFGVPDIKRLEGVPGRKHLVVAEVSNQAILHFVLNPAYPLRDILIADIVQAARPYDGVNIDFEMLPLADKANFMEFLRLLRTALPGKILSVCVPARTRLMQDAYNYREIAAVVDRILVMAYDEHWSGSAAGPVASMNWTRRVATWALENIPAEKLIMGMPFYGRAWGNTNPAGAYKHSSISRMIDEKQVLPDRTDEGIPTFFFSETITYTVFYDDSQSLYTRAAQYKNLGTKNIGFWRLGQEDPLVWSLLLLE